jgi:hypothetical protein
MIAPLEMQETARVRSFQRRNRYFQAIVTAKFAKETRFSVRFQPILALGATPLRAILRHPISRRPQRQRLSQWSGYPDHIPGRDGRRHGSHATRERGRGPFYPAILSFLCDRRATCGQIRKIATHSAHQVARDRLDADRRLRIGQ